jgi:hypothetical protein
VSAVENAGALPTNDAGCPLLDAGTAAGLRSVLGHSADGGAPKNFFATLNALAIVVNVDKSLVAPSQFLTVHAGTYLTGTSTVDAGAIDSGADAGAIDSGADAGAIDSGAVDAGGQ